MRTRLSRKTCKRGGRGKGELERETHKEGKMQVFAGFIFVPSFGGSLLKYQNTDRRDSLRMHMSAMSMIPFLLRSAVSTFENSASS